MNTEGEKESEFIWVHLWFLAFFAEVRRLRIDRSRRTRSPGYL